MFVVRFNEGIKGISKTKVRPASSISYAKYKNELKIIKFSLKISFFKKRVRVYN